MNFFGISAAVNCITALALAAIFAHNKSRYKYYILYNLGIAFWSFFYFFWQYSTDYNTALLYCRLLMVGAAFIPFFFTNFIYELVDKSSKTQSILFYFNLGCSLFFSSQLLTNTLILKLEPVMMFSLWPKAGHLFFPFLGYFLGNVLLAHVLLWKEYLKTKDRKFLLIFCFTLIAFSGGSTNYFLWMNIPIPPFANFFVSIYTIAIAYLITKHNLMDIKVLIAKRDSKIITGVVAAGSFGVLYGVLTSLGVGFSLPFYMLLGLAWYGYGQDIQRLIQTPLETKFLKGFYNVEKVVQAISQGLFIANSRDDVIAVVTGEFANTIQIKNVITVLAYENELSHRVEYHCQELSASLDARAHTEHVLPPKNLLIQRFHADGSIVFWDDLDPELKHRFPLSPFKGSLVIPFHSNLYLQGLVILGPKLSEEPWTQQDIALFASVISQVMIVFDRIAHQEKLKNAYDQLDSLNQELQKRVQEEVQKSETSIRIAQELSHKASLATLATGIAHEIRNPMRFLLRIC
ncbi:MAG: histidine kinase N-terminal 7TM domain-containing protein [Candidatus Margulisiibacteriota bacterium]